MTTNNRNRISQGETLNGGGRVKHFNVRPYTRTSVLFIFSYPPNHIDVLFHTLYKIDRQRNGLHREADILVEAAEEQTSCLAPSYGSGKLLKQSSANLPFVAKFGKYRFKFICKYSTLIVVLITKTSSHRGGCSQAQRTNLLVSINLQICTSQGNVQSIVVACRIIFNTRVERLQNKFIVNGDDHVTTIHVFVVSSKLIKYQSYYVARIILTFLAAYLVQQQQHSEFEDISDTYKHARYLI